MHISATEHGVVRLFAIEPEPQALAGFDHTNAAEALGLDSLDPAQVDIIALDDLDELGLEGYLAIGMGIAPEDIEPLRPQLSALKGHVILLRSAAFRGQAVTLSPKAPLRWIASFGEVPLDVSAEPIRTASAKGIITGKAPAHNSSNTRTLMWVLAAFAVIVLLTLSMFIRITA